MIGALLEEVDIEMKAVSIPWYDVALALFGLLTLAVLAVLFFGRSQHPHDD
jgi:hypothetical protein